MAVLDRLLIEIWTFIAPLRRAVANGEQLADFLQRFGYRLDASNWDAAVAELSELDDALRSFRDALRDVSDITAMTPAESAEVAAATSAVFARLRSIGSAGANLSSLGIGPELAEEAFDALLHDYLALRASFLVPALQAVEALVLDDVRASGPGGRQADFVRIRFDWARLGQLVTNTDTWAEEVYGWGTDFQYGKALIRLAQLFNRIGPPAHFEEIPDSQLSAFLTNIPAPVVPGAPRRHDLVRVRLPIVDEVAVGGDGLTSVAGEAGLMLVPFGDLARRGEMGLGVAPYADGAITGSHALSDRLRVTVEVDAQATGGAVLVVRPGELTVEGAAAVDARFELGLRYANNDGSELVLLGEASGTRLAAQAVLTSVGGSLSGDLFAAAGVEKLRLVIDASGDGFLGQLLSGPITVDAGDLLVGWRPGRGVYFEGGTSLGVTVPLDLDLGPVTLAEIGIHLDWEENLQITFLASGDATLGPLYAAVEDVGLVATLVPSENGAFGRYDLEFGFRPPRGYAIALEAPAIEGGGYLSALDHEYRGALALKFQTFGLAAFGILTTRMPDGSDGFSFVASIFGEFTLPLGFGFFLTGVGGIIGLNRTVDTEALRTVLFEGRMDNLLFPSDPIANADTILEDMASVFPVREGHHVFGPIARIGWGQPVLVQGKLGVIVELGDSQRILILGGLESALPTEDAALIDLNLSFFGEIDFGAQTLSFDASLQGSRVVTWPISGDAAVRSGWAPRLSHIATFGGLHPRYPQPSNLPALRRLSIAFGTNNPRVTLSAYAAVTLNSLQFGARADLYAKGPKIPFVGRCAAEGWAYFDALIHFNPFGFDVALGGGLELLVDGDVVAGLGFDLRLTGPNTFHIDGKVWVTIFGIDVDFRISHRWGDRQSLPVETVDAVRVLREALEGARGFEPVAPSDRIAAVAFASTDAAAAAIDPVGGARFVQRAVPLDVKLEKLGEARLSGGVDRLGVRVFGPGGASVDTQPARLEFAVAQFRDLSDAAKLRAPAFEEHHAGFEVASLDLVVDEALAVIADYEYEVIRIPVVDERSVPAFVVPHRELKPDFTRRWARVHRGVVAEPRERFPGAFPAPDPVTVREVVFVTPATLPPQVRGVPVPDLGGPLAELAGEFGDVSTSFTAAWDVRARMVMDEQLIEGVNPVVAGYAAFGGPRR